MSEHLIVEAFQIRTGINRVTEQRGLAVTEMAGRRYIDPQTELGYTTNCGPAPEEQLQLQLSKDFSDASVDRLDRFAINKALLTTPGSELYRFRAHPATPNRIAQLALVSVVDHDVNFPMQLSGLHSGEKSRRLTNYLLLRNKQVTTVPSFDDVTNARLKVNLLLLHPGDHVDVKCEFGTYFSNRERFTYVYEPKAKKGLLLDSRVDGSGNTLFSGAAERQVLVQ